MGFLNSSKINDFQSLRCFPLQIAIKIYNTPSHWSNECWQTILNFWQFAKEEINTLFWWILGIFSFWNNLKIRFSSIFYLKDIYNQSLPADEDAILPGPAVFIRCLKFLQVMSKDAVCLWQYSLANRFISKSKNLIVWIVLFKNNQCIDLPLNFLLTEKLKGKVDRTAFYFELR